MRKRKRLPTPGELGHRWSPGTKAKIAAGMRAFFARMTPVAVAEPPQPVELVDQGRTSPAKLERRARLARVAPGNPFACAFRSVLDGSVVEFRQIREQKK